MEEKTVRKTTAKKAVRRVATKKVPARTVERKPVAVSSVSSVSSVRKAPARVSLSVAPKSTRRSGKVFLLGFLLFGVLLGVSALIGASDKGELDVAGKIAERKEQATPEEQASLEAVTSGSANSVPTASLVGMGDDPGTVPPVVEQVVASTTEVNASSTTDIASTTPEELQTEQVAGESVEAEEPEAL